MVLGLCVTQASAVLSAISFKIAMKVWFATAVSVSNPNARKTASVATTLYATRVSAALSARQAMTVVQGLSVERVFASLNVSRAKTAQEASFAKQVSVSKNPL